MSYISRTFITLALIISYLCITSCKRDYTCPAYESYFLLDSLKRAQHFSMFGEDSLPRQIVEVRKTKYGTMEKVSYRKKENSFNTLDMTIVYPVLPDSAVQKEDSLQRMISSDSISMLN